MKKEYNLKKLKKRPGTPKVIHDEMRFATSLRIEAIVLADLKMEAVHLGIPYQTLIHSILHRYTKGDLVDINSHEIKSLFKKVS
jgi:predicted DNA binding CopG/RHH family protein